MWKESGRCKWFEELRINKISTTKEKSRIKVVRAEVKIIILVPRFLDHSC